MGEVGHQELAYPGHGPRHGEPGHHQEQHHHEQGRHHPAQRPLHPLLQPSLHEPPGEPGEDEMGEGRPEGIAHITGKECGEGARLTQVELAAHGQGRIADGPAPHHAVEAVDEEATQDPHVTHPAPVRPHQLVEGAEHAALAAAAEQGLPHQHRDPQGEAEEQEHQQEGTAPVGGCHIGKLPDGAKADRRAGGRQHMTNTGRPLNLAHTTSGQDNISSILHG